MRVDGGNAEDVVRQALARVDDDERCELLRRFDAAVEETPPIRRPILPVDVPLDRPPRRAPKPARLNDPRLRRLTRPKVTANTEGSWWTKPDADWKAEQARMHARGRSTTENLIGWKAVGTKTDDRPRGRL